MKQLLLLGMLVISAGMVCAQEKKRFEDKLWTGIKIGALGLAAADAASTSYQISRGYVEREGSWENAIIPRTSPCYAGRMALTVGEAYGFNLAYGYAYRKSQAKWLRYFVIGVRSYFIVRSALNVVHNSRLP